MVPLVGRSCSAASGNQQGKWTNHEVSTGRKLSTNRVNCPVPNRSEQGQNQNSQLLSIIFAPISRTEPQDHNQTIHRVPVNGLIVILRFYE